MSELDTDVLEGIKTGINRLDMRFKGFPKGHLSIIGGACGVGKTMFAVSIASSNYLKGLNGLYITCESKKRINDLSIITMNTQSNGEGISRMMETPARLTITETINPNDVNKFIGEYGNNIDYVIVDDNHMHLDEPNYETLAREHNISIILIKTLSLLSEAKNSVSGIITKTRHKFEAAVIMILERDCHMRNNDYANIILLKNRYGSNNTTVEVNFKPKTNEFS